MSEEKEETRIVITYNAKDNAASAYLNNPDVDIETQVVMLGSHTSLAIRNLMLSGFSFFGATAIVQKAVTVAIDRIATENVIENVTDDSGKQLQN